MKKAFCFCMVFALLALCGCQAETETAPELLAPVGAQEDTICVERGDIYEITCYDYTFEPTLCEIFPETSGKVESLYVGLGDTVTQGEILLEMDVERKKESLDDLLSQMSYLEEDNAYTLRLLQMDIDLCLYEMEHPDYAIGGEKEEKKQNELESLQTAYRQEQERQALEMKQLQESIESLQTEIDKSTITAPQDGRIVYLSVTGTGDPVYNGEAVCILADDTALQLTGEYLSENELENAGEITALWNGSTLSVTPVAEDKSETIALRSAGATVKTVFTPSSALPAEVQAGDYVQLLVKTDIRENVLWIPPHALYRDASGYFVYRKTDAGKEKTMVQIGKKLTTAIEIAEGLQEGDVLYVQ